MKNVAVVLSVAFLAFSAASTTGMWTNELTGAVSFQPARRPADRVGVPDSTFIEPGWLPFTAEQQEAWDAARALEAEAEAARPVEFDRPIVVGGGIVYLPAVPGASNGWAVAVSPGGDLLTSHWYGSPTSTVAEIQADFAVQAAAKEARRNNIREAKGKGNGNQAILERLSALEANEGVE